MSEAIEEVDYLILGGGLAGLVLRAALDPGIVAPVVDPAPAGWKIGEANVPEMFASPLLGELVARAKQLPSFAQKNGSMFVADDSVAIYPIVSNYASALHVARDELEQLMLDAWQVPVVAERCTAIDVDAKVVRTPARTYRVRKQIIDCSGGAMLVASALGRVRSLWPIHSSWRYYDVARLRADAYWDDLRASGKRHLFIDIPRVRLLPEEHMKAWVPHEATNLTRIDDGTWMWQIPLFGARLLSVGIVTRHGPVGEEALAAAVADAHARCYEIEPRPVGEGIYDRFHARSGFARRAATPAATMSYVLVGDAFMFIDPIYSVGTSIAVNKALEVAVLINDGGFTEARCEAFSARYEALIAARTEAFESWYSDAGRGSDPETARVRARFPEMTEFQAGITGQYAKVVAATLQVTRRVTRALSALSVRPSRQARVSV
jgi:hypothetical protein